MNERLDAIIEFLIAILGVIVVGGLLTAALLPVFALLASLT